MSGTKMAKKNGKDAKAASRKALKDRMANSKKKITPAG
jgi:hypothetical protein